MAFHGPVDYNLLAIGKSVAQAAFHEARMIENKGGLTIATQKIHYLLVLSTYGDSCGGPRHAQARFRVTLVGEAIR